MAPTRQRKNQTTCKRLNFTIEHKKRALNRALINTSKTFNNSRIQGIRQHQMMNIISNLIKSTQASDQLGYG